jgi:hypothetical protein
MVNPRLFPEKQGCIASPCIALDCSLTEFWIIILAGTPGGLQKT